jgi:PIN domain nuclease of toxin-antitoxin system
LIFLDTHVAVWLHQGNKDIFPESVTGIINSEELMISPAVRLELEFLYEIKRISYKSETILSDLKRIIGLNTAPVSFGDLINEACRIKWTRDPFDRMITAHAHLGRHLLLTKDRKISSYYPDAVWD